MSIRKRLDHPRVEAAILLGPALAIYVVFAVYPMLDTVLLSFRTWDGLAPDKPWVGLDNYIYIFTADPVFWTAFGNTIVWTILSMIFPPLLGLVLALGLNTQILGRGALRAIYYLPFIIASIAVATMWRWIYDPFFGLANEMLQAAGMGFLIQDWLGDRDVALYSVFIAHVWASVGFSMVLFLAGLQNVSQTLVEAARIDGAGRWRVFRHVILPALRPTITIVLVLALINSLRAFDIVLGMTGGGPGQATQMLALWAFNQSMQIFDFGRGSAISVVLLIITIAIVIPYLRWSVSREDRA